MEQRHVKLSGDVEGSFVIEEALADGRFVVAPEWPSEETSADAILERAGAKRMPLEEFDKHFGDLPTDGERHPGVPWRPSVYEIAHRRLQAQRS